MPFETLQNFLAWNPPPVKQYVGGDILLEQTKLCIFAGPKMSKTWFAQQLAFCIATGQDWLGFPTTQTKVAMLQSEISRANFHRRMRAMAKNYRVPNGMLLLDSDRKFKLDQKSCVDGLKRALDRAKPEILILDPLYKMISYEDNQTYSKVQDVVDVLIDDYKMAVVIVHHDTKPPTDPKTGKPFTVSLPRGPRTLEGWFDSLIHIDGERDADEKILRFELRHAVVYQKPLDIIMDRSRTHLRRK